MSGLLAEMVKERNILRTGQLDGQIIAMQESRDELKDSIEDLESVGTDMDPKSPVVKQLKEREKKIHLLDTKIDLELSKREAKKKRIEELNQTCDKIAK